MLGFRAHTGTRAHVVKMLARRGKQVMPSWVRKARAYDPSVSSEGSRRAGTGCDGLVAHASGRGRGELVPEVASEVGQ